MTEIGYDAEKNGADSYAVGCKEIWRRKIVSGDIKVNSVDLYQGECLIGK